MANIDHYLEDIEVASRGEEVRDSIIDAFEALNSEGPGTMKWKNITDTPDTLTGYGVSDVPASMVSGVLALNNIPPSALERMVPVADDTARFALTSSDAQNGDTVKVLSTQKLYLVVDDTSLSTEAGYEEYRAGTADSVDWSGVLNTPDTLAGYGIGNAYTKDEVDDITTSEEEESEAGNPIVIETDAAQYAKKTHLTLEPVQDLHGYDHPWAGGAGKNKLNNTLATTTVNGITWTLQSDGSVIANGTATEQSQYQIPFSGLSGDYYFNGSPSGGGLDSTYDVYAWDSVASARYKKWDGTTPSISDVGPYLSREIKIPEGHNGAIICRIYQGCVANNLHFKPMIRLATESDATFEPYSNICPISGLDEVEVRATGFNQWDEEYRLGIYDINNGGFSSNNTHLACKNPISVIPNTAYYFRTNGYNINVCYLDNELNYIDNFNSVADVTRTTPNNCRFIVFNMAQAYGATYNNDICINVSDAEKNGTYEPYTESVSSLDLPESIYSGTLDLETGELVVDWKSVDMGTLTWARDTAQSFPFFYTISLSSELGKNDSDLFDHGLVSSHYQVFEGSISATDGTFAANAPDKCVAKHYSVTKYIYVKDLSYSDAASFKTALNGVQLIYCLATPITYQLTPQQLALFKGINNVSTNAKIVQVTYRNGELATTGDIVASTEVAKRNILGEAASDTDAKLAPILGNFATAETSPASASHAVGEYLLYNNRLYKVLAAISAGQQLTIGTNVEQTNVTAELTSLEQRLQALEAS